MLIPLPLCRFSLLGEHPIFVRASFLMVVGCWCPNCNSCRPPVPSLMGCRNWMLPHCCCLPGNWCLMAYTKTSFLAYNFYFQKPNCKKNPWTLAGIIRLLLIWWILYQCDRTFTVMIGLLLIWWILPLLVVPLLLVLLLVVVLIVVVLLLVALLPLLHYSTKTSSCISTTISSSIEQSYALQIF